MGSLCGEKVISRAGSRSELPNEALAATELHPCAVHLLQRLCMVM